MVSARESFKHRGKQQACMPGWGAVDRRQNYNGLSPPNTALKPMVARLPDGEY